MSSGKRVTRRRIVAIGLSGVALLPLGACNFEPLYAARTSHGAVADSLALVDVEPLNTRIGQQLRNALVFQFTRGGNPPPPVYRLTIVLKTTVNKLAVEPRTGRGESAFVQAEAIYVLKKIDKDEIILEAKSSANASYDQTEQRFANYRAEIDAENRAVSVLADMIRTRIAAGLARRA